MNWYKFEPVDTLFFKGAEPMVMGENHTTSHLFPPMPQTIAGALRTAVLVQNQIDFSDYAGGEASGHISDAIGKAGSSAPFSVTGPLFMTGEEIFAPAPYHWFAEKTAIEGNDHPRTVKAFRAQPVTTTLLKTPFSPVYWATGDQGELVSLGGTWIRLRDLMDARNEVEIKQPADLFITEERTGIALHQNRKVREGHLYAFNHVRLKNNVSMIFGVDQDLPLADSGVLKLGGEQRLGQYSRFSPSIDLRSEDNGLFVSLSAIEGTDKANAALIATGKILHIGGWDMHKGFHKPMKGYFPPGTVFNKKINANLITIQGV
ncbi:MAG: type III-B CRISPR module-associated Cmr3 family protein [Desulfosalsimonas sp.]